MKKYPTNADGFQLVITKISRIKLATGLGITKQSLTPWREVPLRFVNQASELSGVPVADIIPEQSRHVSNVVGKDCSPILGELIKAFY